MEILQGWIDIGLEKGQWEIGIILQFEEGTDHRMDEKLVAHSARNAGMDEIEIGDGNPRRIGKSTRYGTEFVFEPAAHNGVGRAVVEFLPELGVIIKGEISYLVVFHHKKRKFIAGPHAVILQFGYPANVVKIAHFQEGAGIHTEMKELRFRLAHVLVVPSLRAVSSAYGNTISLYELGFAIPIIESQNGQYQGCF